MNNRCKLNPCCADPYNCKPPDQFDGSRWDDVNKCWVKPDKQETGETNERS